MLLATHKFGETHLSGWWLGLIIGFILVVVVVVIVGALLALAAGGILALLADTLLPEAFADGGPFVALATAVGFACAFLLSHLAG